jgi:hypothetical protein
VGFQPDWVWVKTRGSAQEHVLSDSVRGATKALDSQATTAEETTNTRIGAFISDGFQLGSAAVQNRVNENGVGLVAWNWLANGAGVANTDGSISSTVSANTTNGFSIVSYTGTGANATVGHGLGVAPSMVICKSRTTAEGWGCYHKSLGATKLVYLNDTTTPSTLSTYWQDTAPSSTVVTLGSNHAPNEIGTMIMYCFAEKKGFSKFGSYVGNGSTNGTFVYTGFKPAFIMIKNTTVGDGWQLIDAKRNVTNGYNNSRLEANNANAESVNNTWTLVDLLSNGFKQRYTDNIMNASGSTYIYMAFAEQPLVGDNPATAR